MKSLNRISTLSSELPTIDKVLFKGHQPSGLQSKYYESAPCNARKVQKPLKRKQLTQMTNTKKKNLNKKHLSLPSYGAPLLALGKNCRWSRPRKIRCGFRTKYFLNKGAACLTGTQNLDLRSFNSSTQGNVFLLHKVKRTTSPF